VIVNLACAEMRETNVMFNIHFSLLNLQQRVGNIEFTHELRE
jgi:hypothetical protein